MKDFVIPKTHHFDFTGILTRYDYIRVHNYIKEINKEIEAYERDLARLKKQRKAAYEYRNSYLTTYIQERCPRN